MNKVLIGVVVILLGGLVGWYYFGSTAKQPGMQIGPQVTPAISPVSGTEVTISEESTGAGTEKGAVPTEAIVAYTDSGYVPAQVTVKKGTTITFRNDSSSGMWVASDVHPTHQLLPGFDQKKSATKGGTYEYTFTKVGTWKYHNHVKATDTGVVVVTE
jgi:plastocyanin